MADVKYCWDGDLSSILLLVHLLPPTYNRNSAKISAYQAAERVVKYIRIGANMENFLQSLSPGQPFLLCVGEKKSSIQKFFIIAGVIVLRHHAGIPAYRLVCEEEKKSGSRDLTIQNLRGTFTKPYHCRSTLANQY